MKKLLSILWVIVFLLGYFYVLQVQIVREVSNKTSKIEKSIESKYSSKIEDMSQKIDKMQSMNTKLEKQITDLQKSLEESKKLSIIWTWVDTYTNSSSWSFNQDIIKNNVSIKQEIKKQEEIIKKEEAVIKKNYNVTKKAVQTWNKNICNNIVWVQAKQECMNQFYYKEALSKIDETLCDKIVNNDNTKQVCILRVNISK